MKGEERERGRVEEIVGGRQVLCVANIEQANREGSGQGGDNITYEIRYGETESWRSIMTRTAVASDTLH